MMTYFEENNKKLKLELDRILLEMPPFCRMYFFGKEQKLAMKTLHNTSFTIRDFFKFIGQSKFQKQPIDLSITDLDEISTHDIENYLASADGVVEMASVTKGSGLRQHHISVVKNAIQTQYFGRIRRIKRMSK